MSPPPLPGTIPRKLLGRPAGQVVRRLIEAHLAVAEDSLRRLQAGEDDPEILHSFRVTVRRLRATVRAYRSRLARKAIDKTLTRLGRLQRASNRARDAEVQIECILRFGEALTPAKRRALEPLLDELRDRKQQSYERLHAVLSKGFEKARSALAGATRPGAGQSAGEDEAFSQVAAAQLLGAAHALEARLGKIRGIEDEVHAHRARIAGKRLRYVLEPVARRAESGRSVLRSLKQLQQQLGDLHDLTLLCETIAKRLEQTAVDRVRERLEAVRREGAAAIRHTARRDEENALLEIEAMIVAERSALFDRFADQWLGADSPAVFEEIAQAARSLERLEAQSVRPSGESSGRVAAEGS